MNYLQAIAYLEGFSLVTAHMAQPCLERIAAFMDENGCLQDAMPVFHIAGTNGKGSTAAILDTVLCGAGLKVGRFTGPHLLKWNERFHVNGRPISDQEFADMATRIRAMSEKWTHPEFGSLTWFEFLTVMAFFLFADQCKVDVAVLEVGLGGRWDATNIVSCPLASAITNIDLDHTQILGDTISAIAYEKAGIIKSKVPVVTAATGEALKVVTEAARQFEAPLYHCSLPNQIVEKEAQLDAERIILESYSELNSEFTEMLQLSSQLSLIGLHQKLNSLVACTMLEVSGWSQRVMAAMHQQNLRQLHLNERAGLNEKTGNPFSKVYWPGRMQYLPELNILLDGAHNPAGALMLRQSLDQAFPGVPINFVIGCFQNKDVEGLVKNLLKPADQVFACEAASRRPIVPATYIMDLASKFSIPAAVFPSVDQALQAALSTKGTAGNTAGNIKRLVVATGSFAIVKEVMFVLGWHSVEDGMGLTCMNWGEDDLNLQLSTKSI